MYTKASEIPPTASNVNIMQCIKPSVFPLGSIVTSTITIAKAKPSHKMNVNTTKNGIIKNVDFLGLY